MSNYPCGSDVAEAPWNEPCEPHYFDCVVCNLPFDIAHLNENDECLYCEEIINLKDKKQ